MVLYWIPRSLLMKNRMNCFMRIYLANWSHQVFQNSGGLVHINLAVDLEHIIPVPMTLIIWKKKKWGAGIMMAKMLHFTPLHFR